MKHPECLPAPEKTTRLINRHMRVSIPVHPFCHDHSVSANASLFPRPSPANAAFTVQDFVSPCSISHTGSALRNSSTFPAGTLVKSSERYFNSPIAASGDKSRTFVRFTLSSAIDLEFVNAERSDTSVPLRSNEQRDGMSLSDDRSRTWVSGGVALKNYPSLRHTLQILCASGYCQCSS